MPASHRSLLIIDDDEMSRDLLGLLLQAEGFAPHTEPSGDAALAYLTATPPPEIILSDIQMPGLSGAALGAALRSVAPHAMVIAMSGSKPSAATIGKFDAFLLKPFGVEEFVNAVSSRSKPSDAKPESVCLSEQTFSNLSRAMPHQHLQQLYAVCLEDTRKRVRRMEAFASAHDNHSFRREAHAIKGSCGMLGALHLQALAGEMETDGLRESAAAPHFAEFLAACDELESILKTRLASLGADTKVAGEVK